MEQKLKAGERKIERCMLDLTWREKQMGMVANQVEWHLEERLWSTEVDVAVGQQEEQMEGGTNL